MLYYLERSTWYGFLAGLFFSVVYCAFIIPFTAMMMVLTNIFTGRGFEAVIGAGILTTCAWPFSFFLGVLPGAGLGLIGGVVFGSLLAPWRNRLTPRRAAAIGAALTLLALLPIHISFEPGLLELHQTGFARYTTYLFWLAGPSLFALPAAAWAGWSLQKDWLARPV